MLAVLMTFGSACAQSDPVRARLVAERDALVPGQTAWLGVSFEIERGWHLYWDGTNDSGFPIMVETTMPDGFLASPLLWPAPKRHISPGRILDHVYEHRVTLLMPVAVPKDAEPGTRVTFRADLEWLVCKEACMPGDASVSLTLPVVKTVGQASLSADATLFAEAKLRIPRPIPKHDSNVKITWQGRSLHIEAIGASAMAFYPGTKCLTLTDPIRDAQAKGDRLVLRFEPARNKNETRVVGVIEITRNKDELPVICAVDVPGPETPAEGGD
jgi:thiol:disulfide interchange protein DsbD